MRRVKKFQFAKTTTREVNRTWHVVRVVHYAGSDGMRKQNLDPPPEWKKKKPNPVNTNLRRRRRVMYIVCIYYAVIIIYFFSRTTNDHSEAIQRRRLRLACVLRVVEVRPESGRMCCVVKVNRRTIALDEKGRRRWRKRTHLVVSGALSRPPARRTARSPQHLLHAPSTTPPPTQPHAASYPLFLGNRRRRLRTIYAVYTTQSLRSRNRKYERRRHGPCDVRDQ